MKKLVVVAVLAVTGFVAAGVSGVSEPVSAASCTNGSSYKDFNGSYTRNTISVSTKGGKKLCKDVKVNFTSYKVLNDYNGKGFRNNPTAVPQTAIANQVVTLKKGTTGSVTVTVAVPDACTPYQIDAYIGPYQKDITATSNGLTHTNAIGGGKLFQKTKSDCTVKVCDPATGEIITVHESKKDDYKPVGDDACKPAPKKEQVCDPKTGETITVDKDKADQYKPVGDNACEKVKVCDPDTGKIITVKGSEADTYKDVDAAACNEAPVEVEELPQTGAGDAIMSMLGATLLAGSATAFLRSRSF